MAVFWLGMFAACLWLVVGYALVRLARQRPAHPFRSIRRFRAARRRMAPDLVPAADVSNRLEPGPGAPHDPWTPPVADNNTSELPHVPEGKAPVPPRAPGKRRPPRPRRIGKLTYVLVDEEGVPETSELLRS